MKQTIISFLIHHFWMKAILNVDFEKMLQIKYNCNHKMEKSVTLKHRIKLLTQH